MVEAISRRGYEGVTVRQVIGLAGVSRRSFYEHFDNRHDCFLKTARGIARRELREARDASSAQTGPADAALAAGLASIAGATRERPDALRLVLCDCLAAGEEGAALLVETLGASERMLGGALGPEGATALRRPIVRALAGALHGMLEADLDARAARGDGALAGAMTTIVLALRTSERDRAAAELAGSLRDRARRAALGASRRSTPPSEPADARDRMLLSALRLAARQPVAHLDMPEIADEAGVPIDDFLTAFGSSQSCLEEALARAGGQLVQLAYRAELAGGEWPQATRLALAGMLGHLAAHPVQARALALVAHSAGDQARRGAQELDVALGTALTRGAPADGLPAPAAAGAFWHTVRHALLAGRGPMLAALSDHLAYVLLAPAIGAEAAIAALQGPASGAGSGARRSA
ncbi:MAG TPA: helix-turn-helix domain-containing protein [Solirubrobacteraceae bacterium]